MGPLDTPKLLDQTRLDIVRTKPEYVLTHLHGRQNVTLADQLGAADLGASDRESVPSEEAYKQPDAAQEQ